jgi:hypothetical protein
MSEFYQVRYWKRVEDGRLRSHECDGADQCEITLNTQKHCLNFKFDLPEQQWEKGKLLTALETAFQAGQTARSREIAATLKKVIYI